MKSIAHRREGHRVSQWIMLVAAIGVSATAAAALKDKPPKDTRPITGTQWQIDRYASDDPAVVIDKALRKDRQDRMDRQNRSTDRDVLGDRGGVLGNGRDDDPFGRGPDRNRGTTWDRGGRSSDPLDLPNDTGRNGGTWGGDRGSTSGGIDIDPTGRSTSGTVVYGGGIGGIRNEFVTQLTDNPEKLAFLQVNQHLKITADKLETDCAAGSKEPIADSFGDGDRACGWEGRAWVVQTKRGKHFTQTDRYEMSKDGKSLTYTTIATGEGMPRIRIERTYRFAPPQPPAEG